MRATLCIAAAALALLAAGPARAQPADDSATVIRLLDQDRLFNNSRLGQSMLAELRAAERALEAENQALAEQLAQEERQLTELRASLDPDEFRARADAFDRRVELVRTERARLLQNLAARYEDEARRFFEIAGPVLVELMNDEGVAILLRPESVVFVADWVDMTERAIERLDRVTPPAPPSP